MSLGNFLSAAVEFVALRQIMAAQRSLCGAEIFWLVSRRLTLRSATGFSQRENLHQDLSKAHL